jgi:hypothetical protein
LRVAVPPVFLWGMIMSALGNSLFQKLEELCHQLILASKHCDDIEKRSLAKAARLALIPDEAAPENPELRCASFIASGMSKAKRSEFLG